MTNQEVFSCLENMVFTIVEHMENDIYNDGCDADDFEVTQEQYEDNMFMVGKMIREWTDGDRFAGWLEGDFEDMFDEGVIDDEVPFHQIEEVFEEYKEEIIELVG